MKLTYKVPPSLTEQTITIEVPDSAIITSYSASVDYSKVQPVITGTTPIPATPDPVEPVPVPEPTGYKQTAFVDFNEASDINSNQLGLGGLASFDGRMVFKSLTNATSNTSSGYRSEQQYDTAPYNPGEGAWEYEAFYPTGCITGGVGEYDSHVTQWHPTAPDGASATLSLSICGGVFTVVRNIDGSNIKVNGPKVPLDKWLKHTWEIKWAKDKTGYVRLLIDGVKIFEVNNVQTIRNGSAQPYFKLGVNRWANLSKTVTIYFDNLKVSQRV